MKHTPEPWTARRNHGRAWWIEGGPTGTVIAVLERKPEEDGNAALMAAAPDLLAALVAASHALKSYQHGNASPELAEEVAAACDAAIASAKGE